jgi:HD-GYP domain-containing protein (c-di-GMP phosphodiesterase class II)
MEAMSDIQSEERKLIKLQSVDSSSIERKMGIAFFLMALVPISIMLYLIFFHLNPLTEQGYRVDLQLLVILAICSSLLGYWIIRQIGSSISTIVRNAKDLMEGKVLVGGISVKDQSEEIRNLVKVFNGVNQNLEHQVEQLEQSKAVIQDLMKKIGWVITSEEKSEGLLELITESMVKAMGAESGAVVLLGEEGGEKYFSKAVAWGKESEKLLRLAAQKTSALTWMSQEKRPLIINRSENPSDVAQDPNDLTYRSLLCVPLRYKNRSQGCVLVLNKNNAEPFLQDDATLLEHVASQIAIAAENTRLAKDAERSYVETIAALAVAVEERDAYTSGHLERVAEFSVRIAEKMKMDPKAIQTLRDAAFLHDVGKIAIEDSILLKPGKLTPEERKIMGTHAEKGEKIIAPLRTFKDLREIVRHHQEWYNGDGYPDGVKGEQISLSARILTVVDVYDALTTTRPYRQAFSHEEALKMMKAESGTHFDPQILEVFLGIVTEKQP